MGEPRAPRIAIVHDWLYGGGAERVVLELHHMYPEAPIYTSYCSDYWRQKLDNTVITGFLQHWPFSKIRKFIPFLRIWWFEHLDFSGYDLVISSSGAEAKGIKVPAGTIHINYCHAPTHYYWSRYDEYLAHPGFGRLDPLARFGLKLLVSPLRKWDFKAAQRPDYMIANSTHIQAEIKKYYERDSEVIFPPVDTARFQSGGGRERHGFVVVGRQTPYKRFDLAIQACNQLNVPLVVIGNGPDHRRLERMAGRNIVFLQNTDDDAVVEHLYSARALLFPGLDDFGVTPVEALAAGTPVIAYKAGGALDYIVPGKTGDFFTAQTADSLAAAIDKFKPEKYTPRELSVFAKSFSVEKFCHNMQKCTEKACS